LQEVPVTRFEVRVWEGTNAKLTNKNVAKKEIRMRRRIPALVFLPTVFLMGWALFGQGSCDQGDQVQVCKIATMSIKAWADAERSRAQKRTNLGMQD
jgi:hypothetical protein